MESWPERLHGMQDVWPGQGKDQCLRFTAASFKECIASSQRISRIFCYPIKHPIKLQVSETYKTLARILHEGGPPISCLCIAINNMHELRRRICKVQFVPFGFRAHLALHPVRSPFSQHFAVPATLGCPGLSIHGQPVHRDGAPLERRLLPTHP